MKFLDPEAESCGAGLLVAVQGLREALRQRGAELVLRCGALDEELPALAAQLGAASVLTEDEVEFRRAAIAAPPGVVMHQSILAVRMLCRIFTP